jgi:excisionase family DNA binding protein
MDDKQGLEGIALSDPGLQHTNSNSLLTDPLWTVEDVATYLKLRPETIRAMARRGELPAIKLGKHWRFQLNAIHAMIVNQG